MDASPRDCSSCASASYSRTYTRLKDRISAIKHDQGEHEVKARRRTDNLNLLQAQLEHEQVQRAQEEKIASLKEHLATVVERTTKIRGAYEKEKKQLCGQVQRLTRERAQCQREHESEVCELRAAHKEVLAERDADEATLRSKLQQACAQLDQAKVDAAEQRTRLQEEQERRAKLRESEHASAVRLHEHRAAALEEKVAASKADAARLCRAVEEERERGCALEAQLQESREREEGGRRAQARLRGELDQALDDLDAQKHEAAAEAQRLERAAADQAAAARERAAREMEQIHGKLQDVLDKKNATIEQLRGSLEAAHKRMAAHEQDMRRHKLELFEQMRW